MVRVRARVRVRVRVRITAYSFNSCKEGVGVFNRHSGDPHNL